MTYEVKVMVGVPASGKSSFVEKEVDKFEDEHLTTCVVSRDYIRKSLLSDNDSYFDREAEVFNEFVRQINEAMELCIDVVFVDATHLNAASRNKLLSRLFPDPNTNLTFEVIKTPVDVCINRNNNRSGFAKVPTSAILRMAKSFKIPAEREFPKNKWGFNKIKINIHEEG